MATETATRPKRSFFGLRRNKKDKKGSVKASTVEKKEVEEKAPASAPEPEKAPTKSQKKSVKKSVTRSGIPVVTGDNPDDFVPSDVVKTTPEGPIQSKSLKRGPRRGTVVLDAAPTARESAYSGPPRYDWIDVVSTHNHGHGRDGRDEEATVLFLAGVKCYPLTVILWNSKFAC